MFAAPRSWRRQSVARATVMAVALALALSGCDKPATVIHNRSSSIALTLDVISGNQQVAPPNTQLPKPVVVRALNGSGSPIASQIINFRVTAGGGSVFAGVSMTNAQGYAQEYWTLGPSAGVNTLEARAVDPSTGARLVFAQVTATAVTVSRVSVSPSSGSLAIGDTLRLSANATDTTGAVVPVPAAWTTSNAAIATVSAAGLVTALGSGTATVTATAEGKSGLATLQVTGPVSSVSISPVADTLAVGQTRQLVSTARDASGNAVGGATTSWMSSNPAVATISTSGVVTGVAAGTAAITGTVNGIAGSNTTVVNTGTVSVGSGQPSLVAGFNNMPSGMTVLSDVDLTSLTSTWRYVANAATASVVLDPTSPANASVFQFNYPTGFAGGVAPAELRPPGMPDPNATHNYQEFYLGFYWKADTAWQNHSSNVNKIAFFWTDNTNPVYLVWHWWDGSAYGYPPKSLLVNGMPPNVVNDFIVPNQTGLFSLLPGNWYKIEWYVKLATSSTSHDGIVKVWVNDHLMMSYSDRPEYGYISDVYFDPIWGGVGDTKQHFDYYRLGHVKLAVR